MQLNEVLALHDAVPAEGGQPDILGDPYLRRENPVYRSVLNRAAAIGCRLTEAWPRYLLMPFGELDEIVRTKRVPFVPSGRLLREVEARRPGVFSLDEVPPPESYHLHEAAHVVAEQLCAHLPTDARADRVLKVILCESFANTVDALACVPATSELHRTFISVNCYMKPRKAAMEAAERLSRHVGAAFTARLTLYSYLHANFLRDELPAATLEELSARHAPSARWTATLTRDRAVIAKLGFKLDPLFRLQTTSVYFKALGYDEDLLDLFAFDIMRATEQAPFARVVDAMIEAVRGT